MKTLMIGWEFPPHISGGLGTACQGLTEGLAQSGVEVLFVIPHLFGDEDPTPIRLIGADRPPRAGAQPTPGPTASAAAETGAPTEAGGPLGSDRLPDDLADLVRVLGVDSPLRPYVDAEDYGPEPATPAVTGEQQPEQVEPSVSFVSGTSEAPAPGMPAPPPPAPATPTPPAPAGSEPVSLGVLQGGQYGRDLFAEVARYAQLVGRVAADEEFDLVHAHDWMTFPAGILAARVGRRPLVIHVHSCEYDRSGEGADHRIVAIEQQGLDAADRVICVSHYTADVLRSRYRVDPERIRVVHNAVTRREQRRELHLEKTIEAPIVLFLGRVTFQKGPDYFLQAAARVVKERPDVRFVLGGTGDMLPRMIEESARLGLGRSVFFTGFLSGVDVERMYAMADIYVMPSVSEPFGIAPLEAMALDVPVIVSRQSGVSEVLPHALKVDFWDIHGIADRILSLLDRPELRRSMVEEGREDLARMSWELRGRRVREIYEELTP
jgi:glycosyltransferase involved in cell wall biosynthesis